VSTVSQEELNSAISLVELVEVLQDIDTSKTKINENSIDDNNGGRITL
jgi:hypothetical protein